jgi:hypothetical protein
MRSQTRCNIGFDVPNSCALVRRGALLLNRGCERTCVPTRLCSANVISCSSSNPGRKVRPVMARRQNRKSVVRPVAAADLQIRFAALRDQWRALPASEVPSDGPSKARAWERPRVDDSTSGTLHAEYVSFTVSDLIVEILEAAGVGDVAPQGD